MTPAPRSLRVALLVAVTLFIVVLLALAGWRSQNRTADPADGVDVATPSSSTDPLSLEDQKLSEEVRKLRLENDRSEGALGALLAAAPFVTVLVAISTLAWSVSSGRREASRQRREDRHDRSTELRQRSDEIFAEAAKNISSQDAGVRAAGAATLLRLSDTASVDLGREILIFTSAIFRLGPSSNIRKVLREVFQQACRRVYAAPTDAVPDLSLSGAALSSVQLDRISFHRSKLDLVNADLSNCRMYAADIWGVNAEDADLRRSDLRAANFGPAILRGANLSNAKLSGARMNSAKLQSANLSGATLVGADLQSAHFEGADLTDTDFAHADINDAYFVGARIDARTLDSLKQARNIEKAHFDPQIIGLLAR